MRWRGFFLTVCLALVAPTARAQSSSENTFENVIRLGVGEVSRATGPVNRGDVVVSFPFEYKRTGTLLNDVRGTGTFALHTLYAAAGSPGFMVGEFSMTAGARGTPMWCFPRPTGDPSPARIVCMFGAWPLEFVNPPVLVTSFEVSNNHNTAEAAHVEEGPVVLPFDLRLEYRMRTWRREDLLLDIYINGERVNFFSVRRESDGSAILRTVAGAIRFTEGPRGSAIAQPLTEAETPPTQSATLDQIVQRLGGMAALTTESPFIASEPAPLTSNFVRIQRDTDAFTQRVHADAPVRLLAAPNGNAARFGDAGTLLYPAMRGAHPVSCRTVEYDPNRRPGSVSIYCLEDADNDGSYDAIWESPVFGDPEGVFLLRMPPEARRLTAPVRAEPAPDGARAEANLALRYIGPTSDRRDSENVLHVTAVAFAWSRVGYGGDFGPLYRFEVPLNDAGEGVVRARDGTLIGRIRDVDVTTGAADFKIEGGFPTDRHAFLSGRAGSPRAP